MSIRLWLAKRLSDKSILLPFDISALAKCSKQSDLDFSLTYQNFIKTPHTDSVLAVYLEINYRINNSCSSFAPAYFLYNTFSILLANRCFRSTPLKIYMEKIRRTLKTNVAAKPLINNYTTMSSVRLRWPVLPSCYKMVTGAHSLNVGQNHCFIPSDLARLVHILQRNLVALCAFASTHLA